MPEHRSVDRPQRTAKRDLIVEAATRCFLEEGFNATSMDQVAAVAGVAKQTLYHHFGSKNGLFEAVLRKKSAQITHALVEPQLTAQGPRETLVRFADGVLKLIIDQQSIAFLRLLISEAGKQREVIDLIVRLAIDSICETLAGYLTDQSAGGRLRVDDPRHAASLFLGMLAGELRLRGLLGVAPELSEEERKRHVTITVDAFLRAFAA